jgi:hypothetical protein
VSVATTRPPEAPIEANWGRHAVENLVCNEDSPGPDGQATPQADARTQAHQAVVAGIRATASGARGHVVRSRLTGAENSKLGREAVRALAERGDQGLREIERFVREHLPGLDQRTSVLARAALAWIGDLLAALAGLPGKAVASLTRGLFALGAPLRQGAGAEWRSLVPWEDRPRPRELPGLHAIRPHAPPADPRVGAAEARVRSLGR